MDTPTDKEEGPRPEDYAHLDTEGLLEVSAKGLIRAMELMGDMTRLSSLANTGAHDKIGNTSSTHRYGHFRPIYSFSQS